MASPVETHQNSQTRVRLQVVFTAVALGIQVLWDRINCTDNLEQDKAFSEEGKGRGAVKGREALQHSSQDSPNLKDNPQLKQSVLPATVKVKS